LRSRTVSLVKRRFSLEIGLSLGVVLCLGGAALDASIAARWITRFGLPMNGSSINLAFVATTAFVLGLNVIFSSFLLNMIASDAEPSRARGTTP